MTIEKGSTIELEIDSYAFEGKGIAKIELTANPGKKYVVFVNGAFPGEKVKALIRKKKSSYAEAIAVEIMTASPDRIEPACKFFGTCGGCKQQNLNYDIQLKFKQEQVADIFERIGGLKFDTIEPIIGADKTFYYRNKMEFSFADKRWLTQNEISATDQITDRDFALGLHIPRIFDKVLDIDECFLQSPESNRTLNFTRDFFKSRGTTIYSTKTHTGYLRNLVIKQSHHADGLMVNLVTSEHDEKLMKNFTKDLLKSVPEVTTVINNINLKKAQVAVGDFEHVYHGDGYIYDFIGKYKFRISANSFFQTNTMQAEKLYNTVLEFLEFTGDEIVYDLYAGAGTITIFTAGSVKQLFAFENVEAAVADAQTNNELNSVSNIKYINADLNKSISNILRDNQIPKPDVIIADPPRSGMNPKTVNDIIDLNPKKIVYVSCNPGTQARDIKLLTEAGYLLRRMKPVDMFPHTYHIENVALLIRN